MEPGMGLDKAFCVPGMSTWRYARATADGVHPVSMLCEAIGHLAWRHRDKKGISCGWRKTFPLRRTFLLLGPANETHSLEAVGAKIHTCPLIFVR